MNIKLLVSALLLSAVALAKPVRIGILDTGYIKDNYYKIHFCENAKPKNFTPGKMNENAEHGNNILHIITDGLPYNDYCVVLVKGLYTGYLSPWNFEDENLAFIKSYIYLLEAKVDVINLSLSGFGYIESERTFFKRLLSKGTKLVIAAGNNGLDLTTKCEVYPACTDARSIVVGSMEVDGKHRSKFSNYGIKGMVWEIGERVYAGGFIMTGTSQATATRTHRIVIDMIKERKK